MLEVPIAAVDSVVQSEELIQLLESAELDPADRKYLAKLAAAAKRKEEGAA